MILTRSLQQAFAANYSTRRLPDFEWQLQPPGHRRFWNYSGDLELMLHKLKREGMLEQEFAPVSPSTFVERYSDYYYRSLQKDRQLTANYGESQR
jgi:hypothetical protein